MLQVNAQEKETLRGLMRGAKDPHVRIKATALGNLAQGKKRQEVAEFLGVSKGSVTNWTRRFAVEGIAGLALHAGRGRPAQADVGEVEEYLRQSPEAFGLSQTRWTLRALAQVVPSLRGFTEAGVWKVLQRAGYGYKRGQPHLHSPDPQYEKKGGLGAGAWESRIPSRRGSRALYGRGQPLSSSHPGVVVGLDGPHPTQVA